MGEIRIASYKGSAVTLSMVKWGLVRRLLLFLQKRFRLIDWFSPPTHFIPHYGIALFEGMLEDMLRARTLGAMFARQPLIIFYYPSRAVAQAKSHQLVSLIQQGGLFGRPMKEFLRNGEPHMALGLEAKFHETMMSLVHGHG